MAEGDRNAKHAGEVIAVVGKHAAQLASTPQFLAAIRKAPQEQWAALVDWVLDTSPTLPELREHIGIKPKAKAAKGEGDADEDDEEEPESEEEETSAKE
jgi:hypothetical protein